MSSSQQEFEAKISTLELRFKLSAQRIRTLVDAMPVGLFLTTESGTIEAANPQCLAMFGGQYSDFHGKNILAFVLDHHDLFSPESLNEGSRETQEVVARKLDGSQFPAEVLVRPFGTAPEQLSAIFVEDVTKKHEIERMKQDFVAMVSHDLRTPLTSLMMTHELMEKGQYGELNEAGMRGVRSCRESVKRLINLVNDLLDLEKIESGQLKLYLEVVHLSELVENSVDTVETLLSKKDLMINIDVDQSLQAYGDRERVIQTLVNLLSNAIKFSDPGRTIEVKAKQQGGDVLIGVLDQGRGIPADRISTVFERFRQVRREDGARGAGSGLGLAICKSIVELNRGKIGVESVEGKGSTFWFSLPASVEQYERLGINAPTEK